MEKAEIVEGGVFDCAGNLMGIAVGLEFTDEKCPVRYAGDHHPYIVVVPTSLIYGTFPWVPPANKKVC